MISLDDYVESMAENQEAIYYLATDSLKSAKTAPFMEKLVQKDIEVCSSLGVGSRIPFVWLCASNMIFPIQVLYLVEPIDEVAIQNLQTYKEKKFVDISKEDLELGKYCLLY